MKITRFQDLECWKRAREITKMIYSASRGHRFSKDYGLKDQIQRASVSIMANIAEGFNSGGNKEFIRFLRYSDRSALETLSHLYVALDQGYIEKAEFEIVEKEIKSINAQLGGFIKYLKSKT